MSPIEVLGSVMMVAGATFALLASWGLTDFESSLSRMHASTKTGTLGLALIGIGAGVASHSWDLVGIGVLVTIFLFVTAPVSGHMMGRAVYLAGNSGAELVHDDLKGARPWPLEVGFPVSRRFSPIRWAGLVLVWMLLWRDVSIGTLIGGSLVATSIELVRRSFPADTRVSPVGMALFLVSYVGMVVRSNLKVAWEVITPSNERIKEAIVAVPLSTPSITAALLVANAVTYTPGTMSIELTDDPLTLYVHVLHFESVEAVRSDIAALEKLALRALPPRSTADVAAAQP